MITGSTSLSHAELRRFKSCPVDCPKLHQRLESLADYFAFISSSVGGADEFWFRGHEDQSYSLTPSALRYSKLNQREAALDLMLEFRRIAEIKLDRPPSPQDELK